MSRRAVGRDFALQHLAKAQRHMADSERRVRNRRKIVAQVEQRGDDPARSKRLLALFEELYATHVAHRDRLVRAFSGRIESGDFFGIPKGLAMGESDALIRFGGTNAEAVFAGFAYAGSRSS